MGNAFHPKPATGWEPNEPPGVLQEHGSFLRSRESARRWPVARGDGNGGTGHAHGVGLRAPQGTTPGVALTAAAFVPLLHPGGVPGGLWGGVLELWDLGSQPSPGPSRPIPATSNTGTHACVCACVCAHECARVRGVLCALDPRIRVHRGGVGAGSGGAAVSSLHPTSPSWVGAAVAPSTGGSRYSPTRERDAGVPVLQEQGAGVPAQFGVRRPRNAFPPPRAALIHYLSAPSQYCAAALGNAIRASAPRGPGTWKSLANEFSFNKGTARCGIKV